MTYMPWEHRKMKDPEENIKHQEDKSLEIATGLQTILEIVIKIHKRSNKSRNKSRNNQVIDQEMVVTCYLLLLCYLLIIKNVSIYKYCLTR